MSARLTGPAHGFGKQAIDRSRPLTFRLDGVQIHGFAGDTVLSAALAAGVRGAGRIDGVPLALGPRLAPHVRARQQRNGADVPMALCPASDGLDLVTVGTRGGRLRRFAARIGNRPPDNLGVDFTPLLEDEIESIGTEAAGDADLVVVGGGVAGMAAALAAARRGQRVILVEQRGRPGGDAALFGNRDGEDPVLDIVAGLENRIAAEKRIEWRLLCRAIDAGDGGVTLLSVTGTGSDLATTTERIATPRIVLATGCADRLAIFPGNRLPGVIGLGEVFHLAGTYGVWPGGPTLFAGGTNAIYHLALLAKDSGVDIVRLIDHRPVAQSRFIDFAKAMGVPQEFGTRLSEAETGKDGMLAVRIMLAWYDSNSEGRAEFSAGSVVLSDGWRPRLTLWARLGGGLKWRETGAEVDGSHHKDGVVLAGSVTGLVTADGCRASGERAVALLFGEPAAPVKENRLDDRVESPEAPPLRPLNSTGERAFVAASNVFISMPTTVGQGHRRRWRRPADRKLNTIGAIDLESLEALTRAGLTPVEHFAALVKERLIRPIHVPARKAVRPPEAAADDIPAYLAGRFDGQLVLATLRSEDDRSFEPGMLVFADSSHDRPEDSIGVIVAERPAGGRAALVRSALADAAQVTVRDRSRPLAAFVSRETDGSFTSPPGKRSA